MPPLRSYFIKHLPRLETLGVKLVAILTAGMGLVNLFSATVPALHERLILLQDTFPLEVLHGSRLASTLAGFALLVLARNFHSFSDPPSVRQSLPSLLTAFMRVNSGDDFLWRYFRK